MNPNWKDPSVQFPTGHELIYGATGSGKTETVRQHLAEELAARTETWIVDPHMALPEFAGLADKYATTATEIRHLMRGLVAEMRDRIRTIGAPDPRDRRHLHAPVIVLTVEEASQVLADREVCALTERVIQHARKTRVVVRFTVTSKKKPTLLRDFGFSELIRSSVVNGNVLACEKASA